LKYSGFIAEIAPEADRAKATVQVKVKVESPDEQLRPEMNARVNFLTDAAAAPENGKPAARVMVPKAAGVHRDAADVLFLVKGTRVEQRVIRVGEATGDFYNVIEGLSGGESAAVTGVEKLRDGDRVKLVTQCIRGQRVCQKQSYKCVKSASGLPARALKWWRSITSVWISRKVTFLPSWVPAAP